MKYFLYDKYFKWCVWDIRFHKNPVVCKQTSIWEKMSENPKTKTFKALLRAETKTHIIGHFHRTPVLVITSVDQQQRTVYFGHLAGIKAVILSEWSRVFRKRNQKYSRPPSWTVPAAAPAPRPSRSDGCSHPRVSYWTRCQHTQVQTIPAEKLQCSQWPTWECFGGTRWGFSLAICWWCCWCKRRNRAETEPRWTSKLDQISRIKTGRVQNPAGRRTTRSGTGFWIKAVISECCCYRPGWGDTRDQTDTPNRKYVHPRYFTL